MRKTILKGFLMITGVCLLMAGYFSQRSVEGAGTCHTEACQACRNAGYTQADDSCSWKYQQIRYENARERYCYEGASEHNDCRANLLNANACSKKDVCNISRGTCGGSDKGCPCLGGCSGDTSNETCADGEYCVGQWSRTQNGPFALWNTQACYSVSSPFRPWDCDCTSANAGHYGSIQTCAYRGDFSSGPNKTSVEGCVGDIDCVAVKCPHCVYEPNNAGCIYNRGWDGTVKVVTGYYCAYEDIYEGCIFLGYEDISTRTRSLYSGNPNWLQGNCP